MSDLPTVKHTDTHLIWFVVRSEDTGLPIDLTNLTAAQGYARRRGGIPIPINVIVWGDPKKGTFSHQLTGTLEPGVYSLIVKMKINGEQQTSPTEEYDCLRVAPTIGAALP